MWLTDGEKSLICLAVSTQHWRVTDILQQHSPWYAYASHCKNVSNSMEDEAMMYLENFHIATQIV